MCVSVVQGMSLAFDTPTLGFSTLEVTAYGAVKKYNTNKIAVALDARMGEVYWGVYDHGSLSGESLKKPNKVDLLNDEYFGVGTAWSVYENELKNTTGISKCSLDFYPKAENLIDLALTYINKNKEFDGKLPLPTYLRNNVAQKSLK